MKYKVGDKVKVRSDLRVGKSYGEHAFVHDMFKFKGKIVTIESVWKRGYRIEEDTYWWTDEMLEPVEEMTAEEAIRLQAEICVDSNNCESCPIGELKEKLALKCDKFQAKYPEKVIEVIKQWKADHEKKPIQTENAWFILIMDTNRKIVHEEKLDVPCDGTFNLDYEQRVALKRYCNEHDGKFIAVREFRSVVKE